MGLKTRVVLQLAVSTVDPDGITCYSHGVLGRTPIRTPNIRRNPSLPPEVFLPLQLSRLPRRIIFDRCIFRVLCVRCRTNGPQGSDATLRRRQSWITVLFSVPKCAVRLNGMSSLFFKLTFLRVELPPPPQPH